MASLNTRSATELCLRSLRRYAGHPFDLVVGDSGSSDGTRELLSELEADGWLGYEQADGPRLHSEWLDDWLERCDAEFAVFVDSDVEFRRRGWLRELVETAEREDAAVVCAEFLPEWPSFVEPVGGKTVRLAARPAPWLMLVRVAPLRRLETSFAFHAQPAAVPEGVMAYDVGAVMFARIQEQTLRYVTMPSSYRRAYRHYGGLSWLPTRGRRGCQKVVDLQTVAWRLRLLKLRERSRRARRAAPQPE